MARTTLLQKIINTAIDNDASELELLLLKKLVDISPVGVINNYNDHHKDILHNIFRDDNYAYIEASNNLCKAGFIKFSKYDPNLLLIPVCEEQTLFKIQCMSKSKYYRNPFDSLNKFLNSLGDRTRKMITPAINMAKREESMKLNLNWNKLLGIKFPRSLADILTGKNDKYRYSRERARYVCGLVSQLDSDGEIKDFTFAYIVRQLQELFEKDSDGNDTINEHTIKDIHNKLIDDGIITYYEVLGKTVVRFVGYKNAFNNGYVVIPYCVFSCEFKKMRTAAYKMFFDFIFKWNNGDTKKGDSFELNPDKPVIFKLHLTGKETKETKSTYNNNLALWLRKRCPSEVADIIYGDGKFTGLEKFFSVDFSSFNKDGCIFLRVKHAFRVLKREIKHAHTFNYINRYKRKAETIKSILEKHNLTHTLQDLKDFVMIFKSERGRVIDKLVKLLIDDINTRSQDSLKPISSLGAYMHTIYKNYTAGELI